MTWSLYLIRCADDSLYTGVTTDVERRFAAHVAGYVRGRGPLALAFSTEVGDRSAALRAEVRVKRLSRQHKLALIAGTLTVAQVLSA
ncbi:MAG: GIY-YIG nuclease family protein [Planctomycetota bacterium]|jgi:putative endonuclease